MALGAMTKVKSVNADGLFVDVITVVGDTSYPTGGSAFNALFNTLMGATRTPLAVIGFFGNRPAEFILSSGKLLVREVATGVELAAATNVSGSTATLTVIST